MKKQIEDLKEKYKCNLAIAKLQNEELKKHIPLTRELFDKIVSKIESVVESYNFDTYLNSFRKPFYNDYFNKIKSGEIK